MRLCCLRSCGASQQHPEPPSPPLTKRTPHFAILINPQTACDVQISCQLVRHASTVYVTASMHASDLLLNMH